jgi:drug/metabolite transporter (DMT)-like permease
MRPAASGPRSAGAPEPAGAAGATEPAGETGAAEPSTAAGTPEPAPRAQLYLAFAAVYVLWGSTYLAIKLAVETLPPFSMAGARFTLAGLVLTAFAAWQARRSGRSFRATPRQWRNAAIAGALLMLGSNGLVCWSEQRVDSSLAALLVGTVPLWMMLIDWLRPGGLGPSGPTIAGVVIGIGGVSLLVWPVEGAIAADGLGVAALLTATLCWASGSIFTRTADLPRSMLQAAGMQMMCGGILQLCAGVALGEIARLDPARISFTSVASLAYLLVAGSLVGFTAYIWLLRHTTAARASTYAFVNPLVALLLGAWLGHEPLTLRRVAGGLVIVAGVALVIAFRAVRPIR